MKNIQWTISFFILVLGAANIYDQENASLIIHKPSCDSVEYVLNTKGEKLFELEANEKLLVEEHRDESRSTLFEYVKLYSKDRGPLVVLSADCFYLIDASGKRIKKLTKYGTIFSAWDGVYKARLLKDSGSKTSSYVFLNDVGEEMFDGNQFLQATNFNEGKAIVKSTNEEWQIISNDSSNQPISIDSKINTTIVTANSFYNGHALVKAKNKENSGSKYSYYFINAAGEVAIDVFEKIGKYNHFSPSNFDEENAFMKVGSDILFFNTSGEIVYTLSDVNNMLNERGRFVQFYLSDNSRVIIDRQSLEVVDFFDKEDVEKITPDKLFDDYLKVYYSNKVTGKKGYRYVNLATKEIEFETNHKLVRIVDDLFISGSANFPNDLYFIKNKEDKVLFKKNECK